MPDSFRNQASTALYLAVKEHIRQRISDGDWKTGERIPSEHALVAQLGVSRMTVHRALRELAEQGLLRRAAGVGSFVADRKAESGLLKVANLADEIRARGHQHRCELVFQERELASPEVAVALGLVPGAPVFHVLCVHREDGVPVQLEDRYVNPKAAPAFLDQPFGTVQPGEYLLKTVALDEVEHVVDAVAATDEIAARLEMHPGDPCLVLTRRTWSGRTAVTFVRCIHPGARYRLGTRFKGRGAQAMG